MFNSILRLRYFPKLWKIAKVIMIPKPGKTSENPESHRPVSLLASISKLFEKLFCKRLHGVLSELHIIPEHQFGFRNQHSTIEQVHRVVSKARNALEAKRFCCAICLDVSQAFDKMWTEGLIHNTSQYPPSQYIGIMKSYFNERRFQVQFGDATSETKPIAAGVPSKQRAGASPVCSVHG